MEESNIVNYVKEQLDIHYRGLSIDEFLLNHWDSVKVYADFLIINLDHTFIDVCLVEDNSSIQVINNIEFPFRDLEIMFSIEVFNKDYQGKYTAYCPELKGCITEGNSKMEALKNICYAIAEILVLNYDYLKINPINSRFEEIEITANYFVSSPDVYSYNFSKILAAEAKFNRFFLGKKHLLLKNDSYPLITLSLPHEGFQQLTKHLLKRTVDLE